MKDKANTIVGKLLINSGFSNDEKYKFYNDKCSVEITDDGYAINFNSGSSMYGTFDIYWLIGVLTYYDLMDKNYEDNRKNK